MNSSNKYLDRVIFWVSNQSGVSSPASVYYFYSPGDNFCYEESQSPGGDLVDQHQHQHLTTRGFHFSSSPVSVIPAGCEGRVRGRAGEINTGNDQWSINGSNTRPISSLIGGNTKNWSIYRGQWDTWAGLPHGNKLNLPSIINNTEMMIEGIF